MDVLGDSGVDNPTRSVRWLVLPVSGAFATVRRTSAPAVAVSEGVSLWVQATDPPVWVLLAIEDTSPSSGMPAPATGSLCARKTENKRVLRAPINDTLAFTRSWRRTCWVNRLIAPKVSSGTLPLLINWSMYACRCTG